MAKIYKILIVTEDTIEDSTIIQRMKQMSDTGFIDIGVYKEDDELVDRVPVARDGEIVLDFIRTGKLNFVCHKCGATAWVSRAIVRDDYVSECRDCHIPMERVR